MTRQHRAYLSLGANLEPERYLRLAVRQLAQAGRVTAVSPVWETAPVGRTDQPNFLNAAAILRTELDPEGLIRRLHDIETGLGRVRTGDKYGPRPIDLDLVLYDAEIFEMDGRSIPSPEVLSRAFVAVPLAEIAPAYRHPQTGQRLADIAQRLAAAAQLWLRPDISLTY